MFQTLKSIGVIDGRNDRIIFRDYNHSDYESIDKEFSEDISLMMGVRIAIMENNGINATKMFDILVSRGHSLMNVRKNTINVSPRSNILISSELNQDDRKQISRYGVLTLGLPTEFVILALESKNFRFAATLLYISNFTGLDIESGDFAVLRAFKIMNVYAKNSELKYVDKIQKYFSSSAYIMKSYEDDQQLRANKPHVYNTLMRTDVLAFINWFKEGEKQEKEKEKLVVPSEYPAFTKEDLEEVFVLEPVDVPSFETPLPSAPEFQIVPKEEYFFDHAKFEERRLALARKELSEKTIFIDHKDETLIEKMSFQVCEIVVLEEKMITVSHVLPHKRRGLGKIFFSRK
jgi:hypothetical protein